MRNIGVYRNFYFLWGGSRGGSSEGERVGLFQRERTVEQVLVGGLLWLGGNSWKCLFGNLLRMCSLGKQSWVCR